MSLNIKSVLLYALFILLGTAICSVRAEERKVVLDKKFAVESGGKLAVDASSGDVIINTWDKKEVLVKILATDRAAEKMEFSAEQSGNSIKVTARKRGSFLKKMFDWNNVSVRIEIALPRNFDPDVVTSGGDIKIKDVNGEMRLRTSGGDVDVYGSAGDMRVSTSGGDIGVNGFKGVFSVSTSGGDIKVIDTYGDVTASTSGGDIEINSNDGVVKASTSGGDIKAEYKGVNKGFNLTTTGGDIQLIVPSAIKGNVRLATTGGDVNCSLNITKSVKISSSKFEAEVNGGGEDIRCTTTGGDVSVKSR